MAASREAMEGVGCRVAKGYAAGVGGDGGGAVSRRLGG